MTEDNVSITDLAAHLGLSRTAARDLETSGVLDRRKGLDACRLDYIRSLRSRQSEKSIAEARIRNARAVEIELRTAQRAGELMFVDDHTATVDAIAGIVLTELGSLPARFTRDLEMRAQLEKCIDEARQSIADRLQSLAKDGPAIGEDDDADAEADTGRMGGKKSALPAVGSDPGPARSDLDALYTGTRKRGRPKNSEARRFGDSLAVGEDRGPT
jgi:phage terminase Nu1 subunit (DNA packaging protein)